VQEEGKKEYQAMKLWVEESLIDLEIIKFLIRFNFFLINREKLAVKYNKTFYNKIIHSLGLKVTGNIYKSSKCYV
jgi:hypothetical protein